MRPDEIRHGKYQSDLPELEMKYDPEFDLSRVVGSLNSDGELVGISLEHASYDLKQKLPLKTIGGLGTQKNGFDFTARPIEEIAIVYDPDFEYVCNVYIGYDNKQVEISKDARFEALSKDKSGKCDIDWETMDNAVVIYN